MKQFMDGALLFSVGGVHKMLRSVEILLVPLKQIEYGIYGDLIIIYTRSHILST